MHRVARLLMLIATVVMMAVAISPDTAFGQSRGRGQPPPGPPPAKGRPPAPHHSVNRSGVVFVGGYFYDPFFGPYPWWSRWSYPYYYPAYYDARAVVKIEGEPDKLADNAALYVDGFYAGVVEDFDGFFEGLPLSPGSHELVLYLDGYRTVRRSLYLSPASTFTLRYAPERLPTGVRSEPPLVAAPVPAPPEGTYIPPATARETPPGALRPAPTTGVAQGTLSLRVQPGDAEVRINGEVWASSDAGHYVVQLPAGTYRIEVGRPGYLPYARDVQVGRDQSRQVNVALTPVRP